MLTGKPTRDHLEANALLVVMQNNYKDLKPTTEFFKSTNFLTCLWTWMFQ